MKTHFENDEALQLALNAFGVQKTQECFPNAPPGREAFYFEQSAESVFAVTSCIIVGGVYCSLDGPWEWWGSGIRANTDDILCVHSLCVQKTMRGIKVGERLMTELLTRLKNTLQSKYPIALMITRDEDAAKLRAFYARLGFIDAPYSDKRVYVRGVAADAENGNLVMVI